VVINPAKEAGLVKFALPKSPRSMIKGGSEIASHYLQPNIGSDQALFNGIAKAIIASDGADQAFIAQYTEACTEFRDSLEQLTWAQIEAQTGLEQLFTSAQTMPCFHGAWA